ncbi:hypothetical protein JAAARDRAFT_643508 [Jaapia argillacea MUCL 33604]|uniref:F-box domain-containing protein n=1 Tax=Jaapia argillacea MUCL 33604 TaxID=933084 RepID=A0A067PG85_9AGAM|nr:hypothetical protein JAAARDRAFT_643508 [Jaapia argillacea MUCL 33604]
MVVALPIELVEQIVKFADQADLPTLSTANRIFRCLVEPVLYREIQLPTAPTIKALHAIVHHPQSTRHLSVRTFTIRMSKLTWTMDAPVLRSFYRLLADALSLMTRLDSLSIFDLPPDESWILDVCRAQPLYFATTIPPNKNLSSFLTRQRRMETLIIATRYAADWYQPSAVNFTLPTSSMPNLKTLCARGSIIRGLVPGRPVYHISLDFTLDNKDDGNGYEEMKQSLALSSGPMKTLGIQFRPGPRDLVVSPNLPMFVVSKAGAKLETVTCLDIHIPTFDYFDVS